MRCGSTLRVWLYDTLSKLIRELIGQRMPSRSHRRAPSALRRFGLLLVTRRRCMKLLTSFLAGAKSRKSNKSAKHGNGLNRTLSFGRQLWRIVAFNLSRQLKAETNRENVQPLS